MQTILGCPRASLGPLSEATDVFDPQRLRAIVEELGGQVMSLGKDPALKEVQQLLTAVDGTVIKTLARVAEAAYLRSPSSGERKYAWRLHRQFEVDRQIPSLLDVTGASGKGEQDERYVLKQHLQAGRCYIMARGYAKFALFQAIHAAGRNYVCRLRDNSNYGPEEELAIDETARQAASHEIPWPSSDRIGRVRTDLNTRSAWW